MANEASSKPDGAVRWVEAADGGLTIEMVSRSMKVSKVAHSELDALVDSDVNAETGFFGVAAGSFVAFFTVITTVDIPDPGWKAIYAALLVVSGFFALYFGYKVRKGQKQLTQKLNDLKGRSITP